MKGAKIARMEVESGVGALKLQGFENRERFFETVKRNLGIDLYFYARTSCLKVFELKNKRDLF